MTNKELFDEKNIELFMPDGVEFIYNFLENTGFLNFTTSTARKKGLEVIRKLLELELLEVFHCEEEQNILKDKNISNEEIMKILNKIWFEGADYQDFLNMPMFKYKDWYLNALVEKGLTPTTYWRTFVKEEIGSLETWIEDNRPK